MRRGKTIAWSVAVILLLASSSAAAKEPLPDVVAAKSIAADWLHAIAAGSIVDAARLSTFPFRASGFEKPACQGDKTAEDEPKMRDILRCAYDEILTEGTREQLGQNDLAVLDEKGIASPGWKVQRKYLRRLMRTERLVWRIYQDEDILHIVVLGLRTTANGPKVTSVTYHTDTLGG